MALMAYQITTTAILVYDWLSDAFQVSNSSKRVSIYLLGPRLRTCIDTERMTNIFLYSLLFVGNELALPQL